MAIVNRTLDVSEQKEVVQANVSVIETGKVYAVGNIASPGILSDVKLAALGISGSPVVQLHIQRFIVGTGITLINPGSTTTALTALGTSGQTDVLLASAGSTLLNLVAGDVLTLTTTGANSGAASLSVASVVQATQDIRTYYGS